MKRTLVIASLIGLFMVASLDLQARHRRNNLPRVVRGGITIAMVARLARHDPFYGRGRHIYQEQQIVRELRRNERRIWKLERKLDRLQRYRGSYRKMRQLEQEIHWLESRNRYLRNRLY
ncbi:MAG TPA: hypothetical protein VLQ89_08075 [Candidatus Binatia bacterium]|nr:hypothetical protein [Candidatus Binatia bacterium]